MIILPAIDLKDGEVVRLYKGDFQTVHQVARDPLETALDFFRAGARQIHMVDLDGAKDGVRKNGAIVEQIARHSGLKVELGGGIRTMEDLEELFSLGIHRAVIGSGAVRDPDIVRRAAERYGAGIAVGIDTQNGRVRTAGWLKDSGLVDLDFARQMEALGVQTIIFTDIDTDGTLSGPAFDKLRALRNTVGCNIIASGGVATNGDIQRLRDEGYYGAIIGKAYYAGTLDLARAVADSGAQE